MQEKQKNFEAKITSNRKETQTKRKKSLKIPTLWKLKQNDEYLSKLVI